MCWTRTSGEFPVRTHPTETARPSRFIASTQPDLEPQFSPDGKKIAFSSSRSGSYEIWVCDREGRNPVQLTSFNGPELGSPRWSPDSRWVAFDSPKAGNSDIYVISADGGPPRRLTSGPSNNVRPSWSKDGRWIYFGSNRSGVSQIWKEPAAGGTAVQVTKGGGEEAFESTDGKFVYWAKLGVTGIWRVPVEGGEETQVLDVSTEALDAGGPGNLLLRPEKSQLACSQVLQFRCRQDDASQAVLKRHKSRRLSTALSVSPDGRWILYTQLDQSGSNLMLVENYR